MLCVHLPKFRNNAKKNVANSELEKRGNRETQYRGILYYQMTGEHSRASDLEY